MTLFFYTAPKSGAIDERMRTLILAAPPLIFLLGFAHSVFGEYLIFRHLRKNGSWIDTGLNGLKVQQIRALWSTWHLLTIFAWSVAIILTVNDHVFPSAYKNVQAIVIETLFVTFVLAAILWFVGTRGKHPAWIVFLIISFFISCGR